MQRNLGFKLRFQFFTTLLGALGFLSPAIAQDVSEPVQEAPDLSEWVSQEAASQTASALMPPSESWEAGESAASVSDLSIAPMTAEEDAQDAIAWQFGQTDLPEFRVTEAGQPEPIVPSPWETTLGTRVPRLAQSDAAQSEMLGETPSSPSSPDLFPSALPFSPSVGPEPNAMAQGLVEVDPTIPAPIITPVTDEDIGIEVFPAADSRVVADGRSTITLEGRLFDRVGNPILRPVPITLTASAGEFVGADQDEERPGFQVMARQGRFVAQLRSTLTAQQVRVRAAAVRQEVLEEADEVDIDPFSSYQDPIPEVEAYTQVEFVTHLRPSLVTGTVNLRIGEAGTDYWGSFRDFLSPDKIDDGVEFNLNAALFGIGRIGDWLFTGAYNSQRALNETCDGNRLYRDDQFCEQNYPVYGDSSTVDYLTPSQDSLYLRFQRDSLVPGAEADYFMWGDYSTTEFARASQLFTATTRQLHGFKANYNLGNLQLSAMYADNIEGFQRDTLIPDGTSGYYFLSQRPLLAGSEDVFLETEEINRPGTVVERVRLQRGPDYEIDYDRGALLFRRPIQATDLDPFGNSLVRRIVVTYQYEGAGTGDANLYAGRLQYNLAYGFDRPSWVGLTYLQEDQGMQDFELYGFDFLFPIGDVGSVIGEYARSNHDSLFFGSASGNAYRLEASASFAEAVDVRAYYRSVEENFANNATFSFAPGQTRYGGALAAQVGATTRLNVQFDRETNFGFAPLIRTSLFDLLNPGPETPPGSRVDNTLTTLSAGVQQEIGAATFNLDFVNRSREDRIAGSNLDEDSNQLVSRLTVPLLERLTFQALNATTLGNDVDPLYPDRTAFGLNWAVQPGVNVRLTQQFFYGGGSDYDDVAITSLDTIVERSLTENTDIRSRYSLLGGANGLTMQGALGLTHRWAIAPGLRVNFGYERIFGDIFADTAVAQQYPQPYAVGQAAAALGVQEADSYSVGIEYTDNPAFQASARFEHRDSDAGNNTIWTLAAAGRLSPSLTVLGRYQQANFSNQILTGLLSDTANLKLGLAYRDPATDTFNALLRYEYRMNPGTSPDSILVGTGSESVDHVFAFEGIYAPSWRWEFYGKYAMRHTTSYLADDFRTRNTIHLAQGRAAYRLGYRWDVAGDIRWLGQTNTNFEEIGLALELGYYVTPDLRVGVGYSFGGVDDRDFTGYRSDGGPYLAINFKVNELLAGFGRQDIAPPQQQESVVDPVAEETRDSAVQPPSAFAPESKVALKQNKFLAQQE